MPYTEKQRKFFHAAAERGEQGMKGLASEADDLAREGREREPVKEHGYAKGGSVCDKCGGMVGEDGLAMDLGDEMMEVPEGGEEKMYHGGEVGRGKHPRGEVTASILGITDEPCEQYEAGLDLRDEAFADAISHRRRRMR